MTFVGKFTFVNGKKPCPPNLNFVKTEYDQRLQTLKKFGSISREGYFIGNGDKQYVSAHSV